MSSAAARTAAPPSPLLQQAFAAHQQGNLAVAEAGYLQVLAAEPGNADAHHMLGLVYKKNGQCDLAESHIKQALTLHPTLAAAHYNLGNLMADQGRVDEAVQCFKSAIAHEGNYPEAYYGLGNMFRERQELRVAVASFNFALRLKPDYMEALHNRANVLRDLGQVDESVADLMRVVAIAPQLPEAHYNLALGLFMQGQYASGAEHYAWRFKTKGFSSPDRKLPQPLWDGAPAPDKTLLLYSEQGLGDTLQFIRYAQAVSRRVGKLIIEVPAPLVRIISLATAGFAEVVVQTTAPPAHNIQMPLMSLIGLMEVDATPYLKPDAERVKLWQTALAGKPGLKVGLNWQGNPNAKVDRGRSIPLKAYEPLFGVKGLRFISLQKNAGAEQLHDLPVSMNIETLGEGFDSGPDAFMDSIAVLQNLDLFITTDTALAHLAGGLGCPTWLLLKAVPDWRWGLSGELTHWYKSVKLFRQTEAGDWSGPIQAMVRNLESWQSAKTK